MIHAKWLGWIACAATVGFLCGQQSQRKYDVILRQSATEMEAAVLRANVDLIRVNMPFGTPKVTFDPACSCFAASAVLLAEDTNEPIDNLRAKLTATVGLVRDSLENQAIGVPVPDRDFRMTFHRLDLKNSSKSGVLAEYRDGKLTMQ
jgi:hypothetical protein